MIRVLFAVIIALTLSLGNASGNQSIDASFDLPGTDWVVEARGPYPIWGDRTPIELVARRKVNGATIELARGPDVGKIEMHFVNSTLILRLPNRSFVDFSLQKLEGVDISVDYIPEDNPQDRAAYRAWFIDRQDPRNRAWWCSNVFPSLPNQDKEDINRYLAKSLSSQLSKDSEQEYCD